MDNRGLIFIPDISGFTNFVNKVDIVHGRMIIQELLEILVSANEIDLQISEIEGDAILFYRYGDSPDLPALYKQVEKMFCDFHQSLFAYDVSRYCQCEACSSAVDLSLKIVTHFGEFTDYKVREFKKLIGKDIIVAHQLLKNDIHQHEYWLITDAMLSTDDPDAIADGMKWDQSTKHTEHGDVPFHYIQLGSLKDKISKDLVPAHQIEQPVKMFSCSRVIETDIITLFRSSGMFEYRNQWQEGVLRVEELSHYLPRVGMKYRNIYKGGEEIIYSSGIQFQPEIISFSETDEQRKKSIFYLVEKVDDTHTRLTIDYFVKKNKLGNILFNLTEKKKKEAAWEKSFDNLEKLVKVIEFPY